VLLQEVAKKLKLLKGCLLKSSQAEPNRTASRRLIRSSSQAAADPRARGCAESPAMKCRSDSSGGGDDPRPPPPAATGVGGSPSGEPSKKQRTEEPPPGSSVAGECSSSSTQAPLAPLLPQEARVGDPAPPPPPGPESGGGEQVMRVPDLGEDLVFEVLMRAEARTLAAAACVSRGWRVLARDERLWEAACVRDWAYTGSSEQMLRTVVLSLGGFRRLHEMYIRPVQQRAAGAPPPGQQQRRQLPVRMGRDQVQVSLSLLSTSFFLNMPNAPPPPPPKDKDKDRDKNGGGQCG